MTILDRKGEEIKNGSVFIIDGGSVNGYTHFMVNSLEPLSVKYCVVNNLDRTLEVHGEYQYSVRDLLSYDAFTHEPEFTIVNGLSDYSVHISEIAVEEKIEGFEKSVDVKSNLTTLDSEKAIYFLLAIEYRKTFVEIDGLDQQRDGFTFDQWLDKQGLLKTL